jgi:hypothetical protein
MKKTRNFQSGPEAPIQDAVVKKLRGLGWLVKETHGNIFQYGFPDLYCAHKSYGARWCEIKRGDGKHSFTPAQLEFFPQFSAAGVGVYVVTHENQVPDIFFKPPNWWQFLSIMRG